MGGEVIKIDADLSAIREVQAVGGDTLKKCYQCATCATVCPLSPDEAPFPRKQMILAQWGFKEKLLKDPTVWLCHQCGDCNKYCPRDAKPGDVFAALRLLVIREVMPFKILYSLCNNLWGLPILALIGLFFILFWTVLLFGGVPNFADPNSFPYGGGYYKVWFLELPARVLMIDIIFMPLAGFIAVVLLTGISKLWNNYVETFNILPAYRYRWWQIVKMYLWPAIKEILNHQRFEKCNVNNWRTTPHQMLLYAFIILAITTAIVFFMADILGFHTPWNPLTHPVKWLGNIGGILLIYGSLNMIAGRTRASMENYLKNSYPDLFLMYLILVVGLTGFGIVICRSIEFINFLTAFFYIAHLVAVFILFISVGYSKLAHLAFRTTAVVFDLYYKDILKKVS
ncbi:MAG: quinone-interacting membrane-bound oxidoreductase complex subunit QmoC [Thermodesulfobacteriaceae bacterium]|nr:quinone-interacting membrane-bound oxidoreductase complex subunit QmoC [Thermodesulfobacteriaceae bacterium]MCX8042189.1 quinone-interacting membrane-bound oxidoreductase complex subunit QmoC [Thermodesulfobacteriaceae bacterium]MDW8135672.1 quinone-interacting membrane-bound oxidoreductase complex subunit QmoC [Thermodesulfobacterium sp.]